MNGADRRVAMGGAEMACPVPDPHPRPEKVDDTAGPEPSAGPLVGIDVGGTKVDIAILVDGERRTRRIPTEADRGAAHVVDRALSTAAALADGAVAAVGVAVPGAVGNGVIRLADNVPGLDELDLPSLVEDVFPGAPLALVNDLNAAAAAQLAAGVVPRQGVGLVVGLGTGTAAGIVVDGVLRPGARGAAGEIGYSRVPAGDADGALVRLEEFAGGRAFDRLAASVGLTGAQELLDRAKVDPEVAAVVLPRLDAVGRAITFCQHVLDADAVVVFGGLSAHPLLRARVEKALNDELADPPAVRWLPPDRNASLDGALHHAALAARSRPVSA